MLGIKIDMEESSAYRLKGEILGPPDTPYEKGVYLLNIELPESYPFHPPKVNKFPS